MQPSGEEQVRAHVAKETKARLPAIQGCYERELKKDASLQGRVVVRFVVEPNGHVSEFSVVEKSPGMDETARCIQTLIRAWRLNVTPPEPTVIEYPFKFYP